MRKLSLAAAATSSMLLGGFFSTVYGQSNAIQSGSWADINTWDLGVPSANPPLAGVINGGFTVSIDTAGNTATNVDIGTNTGLAGTLSISAGDLTISNPTNAPPVLPSIRVGQATGGAGTLLVSGGTIDILGGANTGFAIGDLLIGDVGAGTMIMTGGSVRTDDEIFIGLNQVGSGFVDVSGGTLTAAGRNILVGFLGAGTMDVHNNAVVNANFDVHVGFGGAANGTLTVRDNAALTCNVLWSGFQGGNGTITQSGGTITCNLFAVLGVQPSGSSIYNHTSGLFNVLAATNGDFAVGESAAATYNHSGTAVTQVGRDLILGSFAQGRGTVNMSAGTMSAAGVRVGQQGIGTFNLSGGVFSQTSTGTRSEDNFLIGRDNATGTVNQTGGTATVASNVFLGDFDNTHGNYKISGGTLAITGNLSVGGPLASNAPADGVRTGDQGQALNANGAFTVTGSASSINIGGKFLANPADKTRVGAGNSATLNFELLDNSGVSLVNVAGAGDLDGALVAVKTIGGYQPNIGQTFDLISAALGFGSTGSGTTQNTGTGEGFILAPEDLGRFSLAIVPGSGSTEILRATVLSTASIWNVNASGDYNTAGNWAGPVPNAVGAEADFFSIITSPQTVYTNTAITAGTLHFNNANTYVLTGAGSLTLQAIGAGTAGVMVDQGTHKINLPLTIASNTEFNAAAGATLKVSDPVTVNAGKSLTQTGSGTVIYESTVTVLTGGGFAINNSTYAHGLSLDTSASAAVNSPGVGPKSVLKVDSLGIAGTTDAWAAKVDLTTGGAVVEYTGASPLSTIQNQIKTAYNGGNWTGNGIGSSAAAAAASSAHVTAIGVIEASDIGATDLLGTSVDGTSVLMRYVYSGDANIDGAVDTVDFNLLAANFSQSGKRWFNGDFDYNGVIDTVDFNLLASNFSQTLAGDSSAGGSLGAVVPEPASLAFAMIAGAGLAMRRRRGDVSGV